METALFQRFAALAHRKAGISIRPGKEALVSARIARRQRALDLGDAWGYLAYLEQDTTGEELARFVDSISTHFTSFFREPDHFADLRAEIARCVAEGRRRVRLWSAASSTGEEPYTMAMTALEVEGADRLDLRILATDVAEGTLRQAMEGRYPASRLAPVPPPLRERWFVRCPGPDGPEGGWWEVASALRAVVAFRHLNLAAPPFPMSGPFDVVFCRNVLIYFDTPTRQRLVAAIERLLRPGGLLCIGHTETLSGLRSQLRLQRPSVFRKAAARP